MVISRMSSADAGRSRVARIGALALLAALLAPTAALAQDAAAAPDFNSGDIAWMMTSTALVLMMTIPGLALFYGGMVRKKNVLATTVQSFGVCALVSVLWMMFGYSLAFTSGGIVDSFIGGTSQFFLASLKIDSVFALFPTIPESVFMMFQMTFAIITPALIAGAFAERMKFSSLLAFKGLWVLIVYAPIAHWVWFDGGFLFKMGVLDFAGGTVVHINAGVAGLVAALVMGPRVGYKNGAGSQGDPLVPHNLVLTLIGASLLWVGWFGFNAGSAGSASPLAGMAMANTQIATGAAALSWLFVEWAAKGKPSVLGLLSGAIAGLVAVTPAAGFVNPTGALIIGGISGAVCYVTATIIKHKAGYDDSLDAFGIHGVGGIVGAVLTGVFADPAINSLGTGLLYGNPGQLLLQIEGVLITIAYTAVMTALILYGIKALMGLRVPPTIEEDGLDFHLHGERIH